MSWATSGSIRWGACWPDSRPGSHWPISPIANALMGFSNASNAGSNLNCNLVRTSASSATATPLTHSSNYNEFELYLMAGCCRQRAAALRLQRSDRGIDLAEQHQLVQRHRQPGQYPGRCQHHHRPARRAIAIVDGLGQVLQRGDHCGLGRLLAECRRNGLRQRLCPARDAARQSGWSELGWCRASARPSTPPAAIVRGWILDWMAFYSGLRVARWSCERPLPPLHRASESATLPPRRTALRPAVPARKYETCSSSGSMNGGRALSTSRCNPTKPVVV